MFATLKQINLTRHFSNKIILFSLPLLTLGYFEYLCRGQIYNPVWWVVTHPLPIALNYLLMLALLLFITALTGCTWVAHVILSLILVVIGFISGIKMRTLGIPLMPWDVLQSKEAEIMTSHLSNIFNFGMLFFGLVFIFSSLLLFKLTKKFDAKYHWFERIVFIAFAAFVSHGIYFDKPIDFKKYFDISDIFWDQKANYKINGFLATTFINMKLIFVELPADYAEENMKAIIKKIPRRTNIDATINPNIIVVLSEALWDPTLLPKVKFDHDPLPNLHVLMKNYSSGWMLSPTFGGGTANVEFEVLSGNSMRFAPPNSIPFIQYINRDIESLASILANQGYATTAISPSDNWFYNSKKVYRNFGFSRFISKEFLEQNMKGPYISDNEVLRNIITETKKTAGPDFIFANTMENHYPFNPGKFKKNTFKVSGDVTEATRGMLETYATGVADADLMLKSLVDYYAKCKEPTIIVFFGDHKPILGQNYYVYEETGYFKQNDPGQLKKMYDVPVVVWNNYLPMHKDNLDMSPSFLGPYILNLAKKNGTPYMDYLYTLSQNIPIIPPFPHYEKFNIKKNDLNSYKLMQYDMMFGKQYIMQQVKMPITNPEFRLGLGKMLIDKVAQENITAEVPFQREQNQLTLALSGQNFVQGSIIYFNEKPVATKLMSDGRLKATIPKNVYKAAGDIVIEVKVLDSRNTVIADSNKVFIRGSSKNAPSATPIFAKWMGVLKDQVQHLLL